MGLDTKIYFRSRPDFAGTACRSGTVHGLPPNCDVRTTPCVGSDRCPNATHELTTAYRYYGEGYERGPWPLIAAALMVLLATEGVDCVWYGSDCGGVEKITSEDVLDLSAYYILNAHRPYRTPCA